MTTIDPVYTPTPISQRDGSALANSNCRMASIATGIDYETRGATRSTGAKMRSYTSDQSGGTDSADAVQSWRNGYSRTLTVRDGYTFDNAEQDLRKGSGVHLDVWHASLGSQACLSGSGAYGHTIYVHPDELSDGTKWRVADPWCSPAAWRWITKAALRAGAEEWGRRVYGTAVYEADYPTGGDGRVGDPLHPVALAIVRAVARRLMTLAYPGNEWIDPDTPTPTDWETGGSSPILFTRTAALGVAGGSGGEDVALAVIDSRPQLADVAAGVDFYEAPGGERIGEMSKAFYGVEVVGVPMDKSTDGLNLGWRAVWISTSAVNGVPSEKIVYIPTADLTNLRAIPEPEPAPEPPPDGGDGETIDEAYERGQVDEYNRWYAALGLPEPPG